MKQILLFLFIVLIVKGQGRQKDKIEVQEGLLQLDKNNYEYAIRTYPRLIILFKTYDCNLCLEYRSKFIELAQKLSEYEIYLGEVIAAENKALSIKMECKSYPSVFYYKDGVKNEFPNEDEVVQLLFEYTLQHSYGLVTDLTIDELALFKKRSNIILISYQDDDLTEIAKQNKGIKFGRVNQQSMAGYLLINKSNELLFNGTLNELQEFIDKNAYPLVFSFTEEEFKKAEKDQIPFIAVIIYEINADFLENYNELARQFEGQLRFLLIDWNDELALKRLKFYVGQILEFNRIYYYNYYKQYTRNLHYDMSIQKLQKKIIDVQKYEEPFWEGDGQVYELTPLNFNSQINENPNQVVVFSYIPGCDICFGFNEIFMQLVTKFQHYSHIVFAKHNYRDNRIKEIEIGRIPTLTLYQKIDGQINPIRYEGEETVQSISQSIENLLLVESEKSEVQIEIENPIPNSTQNTGKIIKLTAETFESDVLSPQYHVFVKFYAPWCGHCQQMAKEYELLAQVYKGNNNVMIAEIDWTVNQYKGVKITGFPTLILFYKENGQYEQIQYKGQRTAQKMKQFIDDQMSYNDEL